MEGTLLENMSASAARTSLSREEEQNSGDGLSNVSRHLDLETVALYREIYRQKPVGPEPRFFARLLKRSRKESGS